MTNILLEDLKIFAFHGVLPEERILGTYYLVNAMIEADLWEASRSDDLQQTINYADLNEIIHQEMKVPSKLLEHVAGRIIDAISKKYPQITQISVKITKTRPPMYGEMKGVSISLHKKIKN